MQRRVICHECGKAIPAEYVMWTKDGKGNMVPVHRDCSFYVYRSDETWRYSKKGEKSEIQTTRSGIPKTMPACQTKGRGAGGNVPIHHRRVATVARRGPSCETRRQRGTG
nr:MAG TPA: hypothetical protein [Caudoviricetes sp.]